MERISSELKQLFAAYSWLGATPNGKLVLADLEMKAHARLSHVKGDPYQTAFNEGRRSLFLEIVGLIEKGKELERNTNGRTSKRNADSDDSVEPSVYDSPTDDE